MLVRHLSEHTRKSILVNGPDILPRSQFCVLQLDSVLRTGLLISRSELQSLLPYLIFILETMHWWVMAVLRKGDG